MKKIISILFALVALNTFAKPIPPSNLVTKLSGGASRSGPFYAIQQSKDTNGLYLIEDATPVMLPNAKPQINVYFLVHGIRNADSIVLTGTNISVEGRNIFQENKVTLTINTPPAIENELSGELVKGDATTHIDFVDPRGDKIALSFLNPLYCSPGND